MNEDALTGLTMRFVARMRRDAEWLGECGPPSQCDVTRRGSMLQLAHGLAGGAGSFGFVAVGKRASQLEQALEEAPQNADAAFQRLLRELERSTD